MSAVLGGLCGSLVQKLIIDIPPQSPSCCVLSNSNVTETFEATDFKFPVRPIQGKLSSVVTGEAGDAEEEELEP